VGKPPPVSNSDVASVLRRLATALNVAGENRYKIKAYRRAAEAIEALDANISDLVRRGEDLTAIPSVGEAIAAKIAEIVGTGRLASLEKAVARLQPGLIELADRPLLDAKLVLRAYKKLGIGTLAELRERLDAGEVLTALGPRADFTLRRGLDERPRILLYDADPIAAQIEKHLSRSPKVQRVSRTGSLRRLQDTVGDLGFLVCTAVPAAVFKHVETFGGLQVTEKISRTARRFTLPSGVSVSVACTSTAQWGIALIQATGSGAHVEQLESRAAARRFPLSTKRGNDHAAALSEERSLYRKLGLGLIPPELREGRGEIEASADGSLPELINPEDIRGDLHMHTTASDGRHSLEEMASAAKERGYAYIAITDHSQSLKITNGLTEKRLLAHIKAIDALNARLKGLTVLKSAEVDILEDGTLDYRNGVLKELDLTVCSIHSRFALNREQQTERILRAMDNPYFNILGHATGRLLLKRAGYELDIERILDHAKAHGCFVEINSSPDRLDLSDEHAKMAKDRGVKVAINTDAHSIAELEFLAAGIRQGRRAWLERTDVLNTLTLSQLKRALRRR
jgi:DNA polymerase (family 10)